MKNLIEQAKSLANAAAAEGRTLTDDERATIESALAGAKALKADADLRRAVENLGDELGNVKAADTPAARPRTAGAAMLADNNFKSWLAAANANGTIDAKSLVNSPSVAVGGLKATILGSDDTSAGALVVNDRLGSVGASYARELSILDLVTMANTSSDLVEYARVVSLGSGSVNGAAPTAEGDAAPESTLQFVKLTAPVRDVRTFIPVSNRALADAAQLSSMVDAFIRYNISDTVATQMIVGDGTGENMEGLLNTSGVQAQAWDTDVVTTIRKALRKVRYTGRGRPTAVLLNPADDEMIDLTSGSNTDYLFGGPASAAIPTIWGVPRIVDAAVPQGTAIVGDFRQAVLFERSPLTVSVYPQHSDFAVRGLAAVVGQARAAFAVLDPAKFVVATID